MPCVAALPMAMGKLLAGSGSSAMAACGARLGAASAGCAGIAVCAAANSRAERAPSPAPQEYIIKLQTSLGVTIRLREAA